MEQKELVGIFNELMNEGEMSETVTKTTAVFLNMASLIKYKNGKYGNSAITPINIFCKHLDKTAADGTNSILVRLDDKLSRISNGDELKFNDISDIMGYLSLLLASKDWTEKERFDKLKD